MKSSKFSRSTEEGRPDALEGPIGVLSYLDQELVGWCSVAPRECYAGLAHYRALSRIDENFNTASDAGFPSDQTSAFERQHHLMNENCPARI